MKLISKTRKDIENIFKEISKEIEDEENIGNLLQDPEVSLKSIEFYDVGKPSYDLEYLFVSKIKISDTECKLLTFRGKIYIYQDMPDNEIRKHIKKFLRIKIQSELFLSRR